MHYLRRDQFLNSLVLINAGSFEISKLNSMLLIFTCQLRSAELKKKKLPPNWSELNYLNTYEISQNI